MRLHHLGRTLLVLLAVAALGAFVGGLGDLEAAEPARKWIEAWRTFGFLTFAALFLLLAWRPTRSPIVWEAVFLHKLAMLVMHRVLGDVPEAALAGTVDAVLCAVLLVAWGLTRGWRSWRTA